MIEGEKRKKYISVVGKRDRLLETGSDRFRNGEKKLLGNLKASCPL